jgi:hypothetical protein
MRARTGFVSLLVPLLAPAAAMHQRAQQHLQDIRSATLQAERALLMMQSHQKPAIGDGGQLSFQTLSDAPQPPGSTWIQIRATVHTRTATLIGLVPQ